jgi:hypothetical protein
VNSRGLPPPPKAIKHVAGLPEGPKRLAISFSAGETSALMTLRLLREVAHLYDEVVVTLANTTEENEQTLQFAHQCDDHFGFNTVWLEADQQHGTKKSARHRVVDYQTARRGGEAFEDAIRKYGIPNATFPHCTRTLKLAPMNSYLRSIGWKKGSYDTAIGIRADEIDRMRADAAEERIIYPLISWWPSTKPDVNTFWDRQPFRLELRGYQGNCRWCWKKSLRKHLTLIDETPEIFDFPARMERSYAHVGPEFAKGSIGAHPLPEGYRRTFFRGDRTVDDLFAERNRQGAGFVPAEDDAIVYSVELDTGGACDGGESCEVY